MKIQMHRRARIKARLLCCLLALSATFAPAFAAPNTTTIVVGGGPGGTPDIMARQMASAITKQTGKTVIVENKPGAGGTIAARFVGQAKPDGSTLLMTSSGLTGIAGHIYPNYHPLETLDHFTTLVEVPFVSVARADFPAKTPQEFIEYVRKNPGKVTWSNSGIGSHGQLTQIMLERAGDLDLQIIPYKDSISALNNLLGSHLDAALDNLALYKSSIDAGKVKAIFVTSKERLPSLPNVPTARELGIPLDSLAWYALAAPKGTPKAVYDEIRAALQQNFDTASMQALYVSQGMQIKLSTQAEAEERAAADSDTFGKLIKDLNLSAN